MNKHSKAATGFCHQAIELSPDLGEDIEGSQQPASPQPSSRIDKPSEENLLTSLIFVLPLPTPTEEYLLPDNPTVPPILLYSLPRSVYEKPHKDAESGKRPKEKIIKKIERNWQKSIQEAEDIRRGDYPRPSWMKKIIGGSFWIIAASLRFITISDAQMLARLPPIRKLGPIRLLYLKSSFISDHSGMSQISKVTTLTENNAKESLMEALSRTKKQAKTRAIISGCFLPAALVAEIYLPLIFEISLVYFLVQWRSWKKAKFLLERNGDQKAISTPTQNELETGNAAVNKSSGDQLELKVAEISQFHKISELVYRSCSERDSVKFPWPQENTPSLETNMNQESAIDCTTLYQRVDGTKHKHQPTDIKSFPNPEVNIGPVQTIIKTNIFSQAKSDSDGIVITMPASDEDNQPNPSVGRETTECGMYPLPIVEYNGVAKELIKPRVDNKSTGIEPTCDVAEAILAPYILESSSETSIAAPKCAGEPIFTEFRGVQTSATWSDTGEATRSFSTSEITQPPLLPAKPKNVPNTEIASVLINLFKQFVPSQVHARHELNERRVAEDFNRILKRRTIEYVKSIMKKTT